MERGPLKPSSSPKFTKTSRALHGPGSVPESGNKMMGDTNRPCFQEAYCLARETLHKLAKLLDSATFYGGFKKRKIGA